MINKSVIQKETIQSAIVLHIIHYISCLYLMLFRATLLRFFFFLIHYISMINIPINSYYVHYFDQGMSFLSSYISIFYGKKCTGAQVSHIWSENMIFSSEETAHELWHFYFLPKAKKKCLAVRCSNSLLVEDEIGGKLFWCFYNL